MNSTSPIIGSPLHVASSDHISHRGEIFEVLLSHGADPNIRIKSEEGPPLKSVLAEYLSSNEETELDHDIVTLLLKYGAKVCIKRSNFF